MKGSAYGDDYALRGTPDFKSGRDGIESRRRPDGIQIRSLV